MIEIGSTTVVDVYVLVGSGCAESFPDEHPANTRKPIATATPDRLTTAIAATA